MLHYGVGDELVHRFIGRIHKRLTVEGGGHTWIGSALGVPQDRRTDVRQMSESAARGGRQVGWQSVREN